MNKEMEKQSTAAAKHISTDLLDKNLNKDFWEKKLCVVPKKDSVNQDKQHYPPNKKPVISHVERSSVLDKVKSFLPQIKAANKSVMQEDPADRNIECTDDCSKVIEMDIAFVKDLENTALCNLLERLPSDSSDSDSDSDCENIQPV